MAQRMRRCCIDLAHRLTRRKRFTDEQLIATDLKRALSLVDLVALGVGSTLGAGAYVLAGQVAKRDAGPAVIVSFLVAAVASMMAGLCYAEFGARVPKAGSAYVYIYMTVAEVGAFVIGWNLILEYVIGAASVARTASGYLDDLIGAKLVPWFRTNLGIRGEGVLAPYADPVALAIVLVLTDDDRNWRISPEEIPPGEMCGHKETVENGTVGCGSGGFAPYGFAGIIKGAATCFFAFVGFDSIATTGEEARNPQRNIPLATVISLSIVLVIYVGISLTITMMAPYWALDTNAPFAVVFRNVGWNVSAYIVSVGAVCALTTSLLGGMFPLPRVILAMARDGLLFRFLARVERRVQTPVIATVLSGSFAAIMAAIFDVDALVSMMSIGTLMAYTLVAVSVLLLRYEPLDHRSVSHPLDPRLINMPKWKQAIRLLWSRDTHPTAESSRVVKYLTALLALLLVSLDALLNFGPNLIFMQGSWWAILIFIALAISIVFLLIVISRKPQSAIELSFKTPLVPWLPALSIFVNVYLMINLDAFTWIRFVVWMAVGFLIYATYGIWHSSEEDGAEANPLSDESTREEDIIVVSL